MPLEVVRMFALILVGLGWSDLVGFGLLGSYCAARSLLFRMWNQPYGFLFRAFLPGACDLFHVPRHSSSHRFPITTYSTIRLW